MNFLNCIHSPIIILAFILLSTGANAQDRPYNQNNNSQNNGYNAKGKVEAMRIAFITERLNLTPDEAKQFWPVYNNYRHDLAQLRRSFFPNDNGSDHLDAQGQIEFEQKRLDLKKNYIPQFEQAVGREKVNRLISAEEDFKRLLIQTMRNRRQQRPGGYR